MKKLYRGIFSFAVAFSALLVLTSVANGQTGSGATIVVTRGPHPAWEGKAAGDVQPVERNNGDVKTALLNQPVPEIWLEFTEGQREGQRSRQKLEGKEAIIKVALPPEAETILKLYWHEALKFDYNEAFVRARNVQEAYDRDIAWGRINAASGEKLQKVEIPGPDGRRSISDEEASDLLVFAHKASISLVKSAKEQ